MFNTLKDMNLGWYKSICQTLADYDLPVEMENIKQRGPFEWKSMVKRAVEKRNKQRLLEECSSLNEQGQRTPKSKTAHIVEKIECANFERKPHPAIINLSKHETKTLLISRFGMLQCGKNFKGNMKPICDLCNCVDDEEHRLNVCPRYSHINYCNDENRIPFDTIFSDDPDSIESIMC